MPNCVPTDQKKLQGRGFPALVLNSYYYRIHYNTMYNRKSIRLKDYDYSQSGGYFITICSYKNEFIFGKIMNGRVTICQYEDILKNNWNLLPESDPNIELDVFTIMPNHIHGILFIQNAEKGGETPPLRRLTLGQVIAKFKYLTTKEINLVRRTPGQKVWQRNYYERVIRNEKELEKIREYIVFNYLKWESDDELIQYS